MYIEITLKYVKHTYTLLINIIDLVDQDWFIDLMILQRSRDSFGERRIIESE
ncbi:unnamed protein product [Paramecium sonneborni]|uniref:Uncharacterized protein n=1 Tax=Paramecium sonneborni TaxID=65129 RepID=A0A8S1LE32_9CILI|nr:unnamed protein product [Paramecium sonneborni]